MTETGRLVFAWGRVLFAADIAGPRLVLSWRSIDTWPLKHGRTGGGNQLARNSSDDSDDDDEGIVSRHATTSATHIRSTQNSSPDGNTSWFDVSRWTDCQVVAARPECSQGLVKKQLVLLLKCANVQSGCRNDEYLFIQVREMPGVQSSHVSDDSSLSKNIRCKKYSLVLLQSYSFDTSHNLASHKHLAVLPDLQLLLLNPDSTSVMFCTPNATSSHDVQLKDISSAGDCKSISDSQIIDAISMAEDRAVIALVSYRTADKLAECQCLKFSPACATSTQSYDLTQLPLELLFAAHYAHILKAASISSFAHTFNLLLKSTNFHTSLTMLTETGYVLRFIDGALRCCVNLSGHNDPVWSPETWGPAFVKVISFDGCPDRTAVQLNSACHLVDWATEKVVKCWQSVSAAVSCDVDLCGVSSLILVCLPESAACPATTTSRPLPLQECLLAVVDVDDVCADDVHETVLLDSGKTRQDSQQHVGAEEHVNQALCAASALQCHQAVSEMESQLKNKLSFLSDTWQHLTNLPVSGDGQPMSQTASPDQLSMAVLVEGSVPSLSGREKVQVRQDCRRPGKKYVEAGSAWKRLVDSSLVVGVPVRNVSLSHLRDVQICLVPVPHCQSRILETVSKLNMYSSKLASINSNISIQSGLQEPTSQNECGQESEFNRHEMLPPGKSTVATCTTDISGALGAHDLTVHIFLSYSVLNCDKSLVEESRESKVSVTDVDEYCAQVVVTSSDMLDDVCCLGASRDVAATLTTIDLLALDCIQKHWTLLVLSVVSPITCLSLRLSQDSRVRHLEWAQQFLFLGTPVLQYSRLQVLELSGRYKSTVKIFARSHSQALLLVRFLYTILPEDVTITLDTSHNSLAVRHISCALLEDIECQATTIKQQLAAASPSNAGTSPPPDPGTSPPAEGSLSPKFLSCRQRGGRQAADYVGAAGEACGQASVADISSSSQGTGDVATEKRRFRIARRRFREIWGDDDSP